MQIADAPVLVKNGLLDRDFLFPNGFCFSIMEMTKSSHGTSDRSGSVCGANGHHEDSAIPSGSEDLMLTAARMRHFERWYRSDKESLS